MNWSSTATVHRGVRHRAAEAMKKGATTAALNVTWHSLRHHAASVLIDQGLSVTAVASVLGHSPAECLATYAAWWPNEGDSIRAALKRAWEAESTLSPDAVAK